MAATIKVLAIEIWLKDRVGGGDDLARKNLREIQRQGGASVSFERGQTIHVRVRGR